MQNFLIRAGKSPFKAASALETLGGKLTLSNTGNLLFQHSVFRAIYSPENNYIAVQDQVFSDAEISSINENFTALFLPFANAFRPSWKKQLNNWIENLERIHIPVIVCGIGAQCVTDEPLSELSTINDEVVKFCSLVLKNSSSLGVRGHFTANYLQSLGISDYDIIGCPSLFYFGDTLSKSHKETKGSDYKKIALNFSPQSPDKISDRYSNIDLSLNLVEGLVEENQDKQFYYFAQDTNELSKMIWDSDKVVLKTLSDRLGRLQAFYPVDSHVWIENLQQYCLSMGTRLHGCIAGILSGTPSLLLCHDSRTSEIASFFDLPHLNQAETEKLDLNRISDVINAAQINDKFQDNYKNFENFLRKNTKSFLPDFKFYCNIEQYNSTLNNIDFPKTVNTYSYPTISDINEKINYLYKLYKR